MNNKSKNASEICERREHVLRLRWTDISDLYCTVCCTHINQVQLNRFCFAVSLLVLIILNCPCTVHTAVLSQFEITYLITL